MRILFVESYPQVLMGQQRTLLALLAECKNNNIEPVVACTSEGVFTDEVRQKGYETILFPYPSKINVYGGEIYKYGFTDKLKTYGQVLKYVFQLKKQIKDLNIDVVYCNDMRSILTVGIAARLVGIPIVTWDKLDKPHGWLDMIQLPLVTKNIIISNSVLNKYPKIQKKIYKNKITKVMEGVNIENFLSVSTIRDELNLKHDDIVLAIVGSISTRKGHDRIFKIFPELNKEIPNLKLLVIGEAHNSKQDQHYFTSLPNKSNSNILFLGYRNDIPQLMASIDILLVPSRFEGMGMVIIEAMAAKKPVIGANCGGIPEVIADGKTGFLFNGDDSGDFKDRILQLASDCKLLKNMGENGYRIVKSNFDRNIQLKKITDILFNTFKADKLK